MMGYYILDKNNQPVYTDDALEWGRWFETADRRVAQTTIGDVWVSTVFLGIDHNWRGESQPVLWETMVFGGELDNEMDRYTSFEAAEYGHEQMVKRVRSSV